MGHYWGRVLGFLLLGLGLGLCVPPWFLPDQRMEHVERPALFLSAVALTPQALAPACPRGVAHPGPGVVERHPEVAEALAEVLTRGPASGGSLILSSQPAALARELAPQLRPGPGGDDRDLCFARDGRIYRLRTSLIPGDHRGALWVVGLEKPAPGLAPELTAQEAADHPALAQRLARLADRVERAQAVSAREEAAAREAAAPPPTDANERAQRALRQAQARLESMGRLSLAQDQDAYYRPWLLDITPEQWQGLGRRLGVVLPGPVFTAGGYLFTGAWDQFLDTVNASPDWLWSARLALGASLLILGLWCMRGAYALGPGVPVSPRWAAAFGDMMYIALIGFGGWVMVDWALGDWMGMSRTFDDALAFTVAVMAAPALLVLSWLQARMAGQSLVVDQAGLTRHGPGGPIFAPWEEIETLEASEQYIPLLRAGLWVPRRLQTALKVTAGAHGFILMEPNAAGKGAILGALARYAPERLQEDIQELSHAW